SVLNPTASATNSDYTVGQGMPTGDAEQLGDGTGWGFNEMAFSIEKVTVTAKSRALKAEYSLELAQDLKAIHGLNAEAELANILSTEILAEINREVIRNIYQVAKLGAPTGTTTTAATFDLNTDSNGRWMVEKFKGLLYQVEREANAISIDTRRGKGNFVITTNDVASAMAMAGVMDYAPAMEASVNNDTHVSTMVGTVNGMKVYVDPYYMTSGMVEHMLCVGYKGSSPYDAGMFYCPYVPLQMVRAMGENSFQPKIAFKTRYGISANPFVNQANNSDFRTSNMVADTNSYYRKVKVLNLM
ncbi:MAG: ATP-binding protein, partial [Chloroflexota bacterium]|nr:ATP-binding protein [Chloroflexota bacterium]